ncbi:MAG TPA: hypothetical protein ENK42_06835 [Deltaproteobacteria bacterium]|nr:hypothetical protein [Deltaproteobacteria bacterium]
MYYRVIARCGHLGSGKWMDVTLFVEGTDIVEVMDRVKTMPAVKGRMKGIQFIERITREEFLEGRRHMKGLKRFPYFKRLINAKHLSTKSTDLPIKKINGEARHLKDTLRGVVRAIRLLRGDDIEQFWEVLSTVKKRTIAS